MNREERQDLATGVLKTGLLKGSPAVIFFNRKKGDTLQTCSFATVDKFETWLRKRYAGESRSR